MKIASYIDPTGRASYGLVRDDGVIDLGKRLAGAPTLKAMLAAGRLADAARLSNEKPDHRLADVGFLPVVPDPDKIVCVGLNYRDHVAETGRTVTEKPALFCRFPVSQVGHLRALAKPPESEQYDYEGELAVVIGTSGRRIAQKDALAHVAGYACYNEGSIRDWQRHTSQFLAGKSFAETGSFGPWLATTDEIPDPSRLTLETRLNGEVVQHTTTDLMITPIPALIEYIST
ncbi:MAG: fumarylacetoacetate hydrolase family protein, partial [Hyphomicrobiales bacterium]|nr:fumarylacetoacetate hydrolase family protein [Hyphomicrobiales bacterium]